jgi:hypothetical protein
MNRAQWAALSIAALNLLLVLLFPPYDYSSMQRGNIPTFDGFYFVFGQHHNRVTNVNFLALEVLVVLINASIAWLLLRPRAATTQKSGPGGNRNQRIVLGLVALNLILMLLFPPFENFTAITKAALPTFEGFYFIFGDNSVRQIVTPILYIELALALINGGLLWLLFRDKSVAEISADQMRAMAQRLQSVQKR